MMQEFLYSKIHRATVTDANLNYVGSITIDESLMNAAKIICLNGAAARKVQPGDKVIIISYVYLNENEIENHTPTIVMVDENNRILNS